MTDLPAFTRHWRCLACIVPVLWQGLFVAAIAGQTPPDGLRTAAAVRNLSREQAALQLPVRLRGVVTFFNDPLYSRFVQDDTAGIYLQASTNTPPLVPGQVVEIEGRSDPGEYSPVILPDTVRVVGTSPLPAPKTVTYDQLASGVWGGLFVEVTGIVRSVQFHEASQFHLIEIATGGSRLSVYARRLPVTQPEELLDSRVRVRGVCSAKFNHQRQMFAIRLMVPRIEDLVVEIPPPADPYAAAISPLDSLAQFPLNESYGHRQKVTGTVIYFDPGRSVVIQNEQQGVEVQTKLDLPLVLGDWVEALGYLSQGDYTPVLQDAVYRKIAGGPPRPPARLTPDEVLKGKHDYRLVQLEARLLERTELGAEQFFVLQEDGFIFSAHFTRTEDRAGFAGLKNGSRVRVTGVCRIDPGEWMAGENWRAKSFRLDLRSREDVQVLQFPPWWTLQKVLWFAGVFVVVAVAALSWVVVLRREVAERTRELEIQIQQRQRAEHQREIERERSRVANDLHDDLGSRLTEINMLAALVKNRTILPDEKERYLTQLSGTAGQMVTSLDEIVWAINPRNDTIASLASYFSSYAQRLLELAGISCGLDIAEDLPGRPLDTKFRQEMFFAFKEALSNLVRHAQATRVWLRIAVRDERLRVELVDNGRGFEVTAQPAGRDGLVNMEERLKSLGGTCEIISTINSGTTVRLMAPLPRGAI